MYRQHPNNSHKPKHRCSARSRVLLNLPIVELHRAQITRSKTSKVCHPLTLDPLNIVAGNRKKYNLATTVDDWALSQVLLLTKNNFDGRSGALSPCAALGILHFESDDLGEEIW